MFAWALAVSALVGASLFLAAQLRRQRIETKSLREQLLSVQNSFEHAVSRFGGLEAHRGADILDSIENDDCEMASNLGRLNLLLDQLNGLLHGGRDVEFPERRHFFCDDDWPLPQGIVDFDTAEELRKFGQLPPISDEEMISTDWELLFKLLQADDMN